jgi:MFS transporter, ACS family, tartrate transporter
MDLEHRAVGAAMRRLVPLLILSYFVSYVDRANIGVAALTMNRALGLSAEAFGFGAGVFFLGYFIFEVPSNILLDKVGARRWIARIMLSWGLVSGAMIFVRGPISFTVVRVLLGIAEAGFFPGVIFYLTLWFPATYRARVMGYFTVALPLSSVIGTPVSAMLLGLDGIAGLAGWQWVFLIEAIPSIILAFFVWHHLTDRPESADWLPEQERSWLIGRLAAERALQDRRRTYSVWQAMVTPSVLALSLVYFGVGANSYGMAFFLPQIVKAFGLSNLQTGFVAAIPFLIGTIGMLYWARRSDRLAERRVHTAAALALAGIGMVVAAWSADPMVRMIGLCAASLGTFASLPVFWTLPTAFLSGTAAAAGIAVINALGNLAGFVGPYALGYFREHTGDYAGGLITIGALALLAAVIVLAVAPRGRRVLAEAPHDVD